jgi:cytoskeletal protein RodZ
MKKPQKGFAHVEAFLLFVIIAIIGSMLWYVWHATQQANKNLNSANGPNSVSSNKKSTDQSDASSISSSKSKVSKVSPAAPAPAPAPFVSASPTYQTTTPTVVNNYITINNWNVKVKNNGKITIMYAHDKNDKNNRAVFFGSKELLNKNKACKAEFYPAGYIARYKSTETVFDANGKDTKMLATVYASGLSTDPDLKNKPYKQIGDYFYFYRGPVAKCSELKEIQDLQDQSAAAVKSFFDSLEAAS